tara:strand:- start:345 stop:467 length:123 start_codon:yes stop_codon:yes gene_type:complete
MMFQPPRKKNSNENNNNAIDECENEEGFKRLLSIGFRIVQ